MNKHKHYCIYNDDNGFYINHYTEGKDGMIYRETVYSGIKTEQEAARLEKQLNKAAKYLPINQ